MDTLWRLVSAKSKDWKSWTWWTNVARSSKMTSKAHSTSSKTSKKATGKRFRTSCSSKEMKVHSSTLQIKASNGLQVEECSLTWIRIWSSELTNTTTWKSISLKMTSAFKNSLKGSWRSFKKFNFTVSSNSTQSTGTWSHTLLTWRLVYSELT